MYNGRPQLPERSPAAQVHANILAWALVKRQQLDPAPTDSISKAGVPRQCEHCVLRQILWQIVDQIHEPVLQPAEVQPVNDMNYQWRLHQHAPL
jgi:hypothetical protein